jgi:hypothetical protein
MQLPTLAGMRSDLIEKVVDVTALSYPVMPYMNMHKYPIKIDQVDMGKISYPLTRLRSDTMRCKIMVPMANLSVSRPQTVYILL